MIYDLLFMISDVWFIVSCRYHKSYI